MVGSGARGQERLFETSVQKGDFIRGRGTGPWAGRAALGLGARAVKVSRRTWMRWRGLPSDPGASIVKLRLFSLY